MIKVGDLAIQKGSDFVYVSGTIFYIIEKFGKVFNDQFHYFKMLTPEYNNHTVIYSEREIKNYFNIIKRK